MRQFVFQAIGVLCPSMATPLAVLVIACGASDIGAPDNPPCADCMGDAAADAPRQPCRAGVEPSRSIGVPVTSADNCVDTESPQVIDVCLGKESLGWSRYHCYRRISDGKEFWLSLWFVNHPDPTTWERCENEPVERDPRPPPPCFAAACPPPQPASQGRILSTCSEEVTRSRFRCGGSGRNDVWDENCCLRRQCESASDCAEGQECRLGYQDSLMYCFVSGPDPPYGCQCAGSTGGPPSSYCFAVR